MPIYTNIGGGSKQLTSLYINNNGSNKQLTYVYSNINGSSKQIYIKIYKWAKYSRSTPYLELKYRYGSWTQSCQASYKVYQSLSVDSTAKENASGHGKLNYNNPISHSERPGRESSTIGYYCCAPYDTFDTNSSPIRSNMGNGYYAYRISGITTDLITKFDQEVRANYRNVFDNFVEYLTSTNKNAYPNGISGDYKYVLLN